MPLRRIGGVAVWLHAFFDLGTRWRWVVSFTPRPIYPEGNSPLMLAKLLLKSHTSFASTTLSRTTDYVSTSTVYPKVLELAAWSENCKWYSSLPLGELYRYFASQSSEFYRHNHLCYFSKSVYCYRHCSFRYRLSLETFGYTLVLCPVTCYLTPWNLPRIMYLTPLVLASTELCT
jgi:hypothetical protein